MPYCVTCLSMSTDPGSLNPGTRRSRVPGWLDPGIRRILGQVTQFGQNILNLYYSTGSWKLFHTPYWHSVSEGGSVSSSWKWWPVIMSPAHSPLQLPILLHSMTLADYIGDKNWIQQVLVGLSSSFPINYTCYHYTAVGKYCTLCVQMLDGANWHEAPWKLDLFTFWLWSGHCSQFALISTAMIQIYILGARLMSFIQIKHISMPYFE